MFFDGARHCVCVFAVSLLSSRCFTALPTLFRALVHIMADAEGELDNHSNKKRRIEEISADETDPAARTAADSSAAGMTEEQYKARIRQLLKGTTKDSLVDLLADMYVPMTACLCLYSCCHAHAVSFSRCGGTYHDRCHACGFVCACLCDFARTCVVF